MKISKYVLAKNKWFDMFNLIVVAAIDSITTIIIQEMSRLIQWTIETNIIWIEEKNRVVVVSLIININLIGANPLIRSSIICLI